MTIKVFNRIFKDNEHYEQYENIPYIDSLAYVVQEFLYTDIPENDDHYLDMDGRIRLYDFMTMVAYFIFPSTKDLGKTTIKDYIADLHQRGRNQIEQDCIEYIDNDYLKISNASTPLVISIIWAAYIYTKVVYIFFKEKKREAALKMLYDLMLEENYFDEKYFKSTYVIKHSKEATNLMIQHIRKKIEEDETNEDSLNNSTENENPAEALEQRIKELEAENETLRKDNEELKEIKSIMDTPLDGIEADSKVGLTLLLKLMEKDGANFEKSKNKTVAVKALKMITGRSESACKQIFSVPLSPTYPTHKKKISELNGYLKTLGMKTSL